MTWAVRLADGLACLGAERYAAILLDLSLPDSQGLETLQAVLARAPDVPIVVLTGLDDEELALRALQAGAQDYVAKGHRDGVLLTRTLRYAIERKRLTEDLRASEERFRLLAEHAQDVIFRYRLAPTPGFEYISPSVSRTLGYAPEEFYADPDLHLKIVDPHDRPLLESALQDAAAASQPPLALRWRRKDGSLVWMTQSIVPIAGPAGNVVAIEGITRDVTERMGAEEALGASEDRFRTLLQTAPSVILLLSPDGRILEFNHEAERLYGRKREEVLGQNYLELFLPSAVRGAVAADIARVLADAPTRGFENPVRASDDRESVLLWNVGPVLNVQGQPAGILAVGHDITERKRAEEALRRSEESLARAQAIAHLGSWEWEITTGDLRWSDETYRIFGSTPQEFEVTYQMFLEFVHPEDRAAVEQAIAAAVYGNGPYHIEHRVLRQDGSERIVREEGAVVFDAAGWPVRMTGTVQDITESKRMEEERARLQQQLEAERNWLRTVIDYSPVGILLVEGPEGKRVKANRRAEELLGRPIAPERGMYQYVGQIFHRDGAPLTPEEMVSTRALRGEVRTLEELVLRRPSAEPIPILVNGAPIRDRAGNVVGAVVVFEDITHLKELERLREEWMAVIAHDLRQPLTAINGFAGLLARQLREVPSMHAKAEEILASTRQMSRMITDLLDASRLEAQRLKIEPQPVDLPALVAAVVERTAAILQGHPVRVALRGNVPSLQVDPGRIEQVLANLLTNAAKYGYPGTEVLIEVAYQDHEVLVSVTNHGEGIAPEELPRLFRRFQRTRSAKERKIEGIGLGLYIVKGLVEAHGGRIWAESTPGQTTTFRFVLPVAPVSGGIGAVA